MAIDLQKEKECEFSAFQRYEIISNAVIDAYDGGFMNNFVFERALWCYTLAAFSEDEEILQNEIVTIHSNPLVYWTEHLEEIEEMLKEHNELCLVLANESSVWFEDYTEYAYSTRGMLDNLGDIMAGVTQRAQDELTTMGQNGELTEVMEIAKEWGLDRGIELDKPTANIIELPADSLLQS